MPFVLKVNGIDRNQFQGKEPVYKENVRVSVGRHVRKRASGKTKRIGKKKKKETIRHHKIAK